MPSMQVFQISSTIQSQEKRLITFSLPSFSLLGLPRQIAPRTVLSGDRKVLTWGVDQGGDQTSLDTNAKTRDAQAFLLDLICLLWTPRLCT